jgi:hypothetical protein
MPNFDINWPTFDINDIVWPSFSVFYIQSWNMDIFEISDPEMNFNINWPTFSSPKPKVQGELLVSKGDTPASGVCRHASTNHLLLWNCWADLPHILSVASLWQLHLNLLMSFQLAPLRGHRAKNRKTFIHFLLLRSPGQRSQGPWLKKSLSAQ